MTTTPRSYHAMSLEVVEAATEDQTWLDAIDNAGALLVDIFKAGGKLLVCGNGGSAADAQHFVGELVGTFANRARPPLPAIALTTDTSVLTAVGNDLGYERVFSRQVAALGRRGDVLMAISTSGNSENVLRAARQADLEGMKVIALTGRDGGQLGVLSDEIGFWTLRAPADTTPFIQQLHQVAYHCIAAMVEERMFG